MNPTAPMRRSLSSYLMPSLVDIVFISLLLALAYGTPSLRLLNDPGIGWHIRTGEWILQNYSIPHTDLFSTLATRPWFAWEWLFDVGVAQVHSWWGLNGVLAGGALLVALTFALLFQLTLRRGAPFLPTAGFVVLALLASTIHCLARPHLFTWLFTLLCWYLLEQKRDTPWLWAIPAIVLIWANVHGGFLIAFALGGLTLAGDLLTPSPPQDARREDARRASIRLGRVLALSLAASLFNPYKASLYTHIYQYLTDTFLIHHIQEMQSPDFHSFAAKCFAALLFLTACIAVSKRRQLRLGELFVLVFFAYAALFAVRNIPVACIVLTLTVAPLLTRDQQAPVSFSQRMAAMESRSRGHAWAVLFILVTLATCANHGNFFGQPLIHASFNADRFPLRAVAYLNEHPSQGPLFTTDAWGGYVIYRLWPNQRTVVDDRHDMYGSDYMKRYLKIIDGEPDWAAHLQATGAHSVLVSSTSALASLLRLTPEWRLVYDDKQAVLFEHKPGAP